MKASYVKFATGETEPLCVQSERGFFFRLHAAVKIRSRINLATDRGGGGFRKTLTVRRIPSDYDVGSTFERI